MLKEEQISVHFELFVSNYYKKCKCNMPKLFSDDKVGILKKRLVISRKYTLRLTQMEMGKLVLRA